MNRSCWVEDARDVIKDGFDFHLSEHQQLSSSQLKTFGLKLVTIILFQIICVFREMCEFLHKTVVRPNILHHWSSGGYSR